jgi:uncharacterized HAD superfamily protein
MERNIIGIDIDGTIRNWLDKVTMVYMREMPGKTWHSPVIQYDIAPFFEIGNEIYLKIFDEWAKEIYTQAEPYPGAIEFVKELAARYKVVLLSSQPNAKIEGYTDQWLVKHGLSHIPVVYRKDKENYPGLMCLLDDCTENLRKVAKIGICAIAINRTWNQDWDGIRISEYCEFFKHVESLVSLRSLLSEIDNLGMGQDAPIIENEQGGKQSKLNYRFDLTDPMADFKLAEVLANGAAKYSVDNWRLIDVNSHLNHAMSHLAAFKAGDTTDDHLGHALCRIHMAVAKHLRPNYLGQAQPK